MEFRLRRKVSRVYVWILKCIMCLSCASYKCCTRVCYVDSASMLKFGCTVTRECRGSVIYDEVVLWDIHVSVIKYCA